MAKTKIEYCDETWNPIVMRCTPVSNGCKNCWHLRMCNRFQENPSIPVWKQDIYAGNSKPQIDERILTYPIRLKTPSIISVQFMGDLFHESIHNEMIKDVFEVIKNESRHTFLVLTKRPQRMFDLAFEIDYRLDNLWLGVSIENQITAEYRTLKLLEIPASHYWVSAEPLLGEIDFSKIVIPTETKARLLSSGGYIQWIVCGAETGPGARHCDPDWVRSLKSQCIPVDIPFFFKKFADGTREIDGRTHDDLPWKRIG
jgi:protein gp37